MDPFTPNTLYAGAYGGVFKSTDGGSNWTAVNTGLTDRQVWFLVIDPTRPHTFCAGTWDSAVFANNIQTRLPAAYS